MRLLTLLLALAAVRTQAAAPAAPPCGGDAEKSIAAALAAPKPDVPEDARWELLAYYKWKAFAAKDPKACAPLKALRFTLETAQGPVPGDSLCRDLYTRLAFVRGYVARDPDVRTLCLADVRNVNRSITPGPKEEASFKESCGLIAAREKPIADICAKAIAMLPFRPGPRDKHLRRCVCEFESMEGRGRCHDDPANDERGFLGPYRYDAFNALAKALPAKDPELCGPLELCRGLAGQAAELARRHASAAAGALCATSAAPAGPSPAGPR